MTKTWKKFSADFPYRTEHSFVFYKDSFYMFGGYGPNHYSNEVFRYDIG